MVKLPAAHPSQLPLLEALVNACNAPEGEREKATAKFAFHLGAASTAALLNGAKEDELAACIERAFHLIQFVRAYNG